MKNHTHKVTNDKGTLYYNEFNEFHRTDGPAMENIYGDKCWLVNGKMHRDDGPALEHRDGLKEWFMNDKRHRLDGPAIEYSDGNKDWFINGEKYNESDFIKESNKLKAKELLRENLVSKRVDKLGSIGAFIHQIASQRFNDKKYDSFDSAVREVAEEFNNKTLSQAELIAAIEVIQAETKSERDEELRKYDEENPVPKFKVGDYAEFELIQGRVVLYEIKKIKESEYPRTYSLKGIEVLLSDDDDVSMSDSAYCVDFDKTAILRDDLKNKKKAKKALRS